jgi:peptidyl-prolyl cis-trans isomerase C
MTGKSLFALKSVFPLVLLSLGATTWSHAADPNVVAEINGMKLSKEEFDRRYKESIANFRFGAPTKAAVLDEIIQFELAAQEARKLGLDRDPRVQERISMVLHNSLIESQLAERFRGAIDISEKEARDFCRRNPAVRFSHIYVALPPAALKTQEEAARKKIAEAQAALAQGMAFERAVARFSEGATVAAGGDTGFVNKSQIDPTLYAEARKLRPGEVSKNSVRSQLGLHLVRTTAVQECGNINIPEWQRLVFDEKRVKITQDYLAGLRAKGKVTINSALVRE